MINSTEVIGDRIFLYTVINHSLFFTIFRNFITNFYFKNRTEEETSKKPTFSISNNPKEF